MVRPVLFTWVCLPTSPAVVNCIKAVSGSMATFYNSYFYRGRSKAQRVYQLEKTVGIRRKKERRGTSCFL